MSTLHAGRVVLRPFTHDDIAAFAAYRSDPEVARYQGWEIPFTLAHAAEFVHEMQRTVPGAPGTWYQYGLSLVGTSELIGDCAFHVPEETPDQAAIAFTLARPWQHKGYATEAARRLLEHLFDTLKLRRVTAVCDVENAASVRVLERLGMRREGQFVENLWFKGRWGSEYAYGLLRREWEAQRLSRDGARSQDRIIGRSP
jgi:RimJ/RimL family protein N-acetyltransferase